MIVAAYNPETDDLEKTFIAEYSPEGTSAFEVKNTNGFTNGKRILLGKMGGEKSEVLTTGTITYPDTIAVTVASDFAHDSDDPVYLLRYDQINFYKASSENGSYSLLATLDVDVDNSDLVTKYNDPSGLPTDFYKVKYRHSPDGALSDFSDPIQGTGYGVTRAGNIIDQVVRKVNDTNYNVLGPDEYLDLMNEVNSDMLLQTHKPYKFLKKSVPLDTVAAQGYIDLAADVPDFWKFNYLVYSWTTGGVTTRYQIKEPLSQEDFVYKYNNNMFQDNDELLDIAIDEDNNRILLGPAPKTNQSAVIELHYYKMFDEITGTGSIVETPTNVIYRYKMLEEFYTTKAETDKTYLNLAAKYESKYGNELVKMQRVNRVDAGTPRSFAPRVSPRYRKRYKL